MLLIDGVRGILTDAGMGRDAVQEILTMLDTNQAEVRAGGSRLRDLPAGACGNSATAQDLQLHAGKAHHHVTRAMQQMVEGLEKYQQSVAHFREDVHETDDAIGRDLGKRTARVAEVDPNQILAAGDACLATPDFSTSATCEVPVGEDRP